MYDFEFIDGTVGEGGRNIYSDVWTVQRLLYAAGVYPQSAVDGIFTRGGATAKALLSFQQKWNDALGVEFDLPAANKRTPLTLLQPDDDWLLRMAASAQILIPMPGIRDFVGISQLHDWLKSKGFKYEPAADSLGEPSRSFWPIHGRPNLAIQLQRGLKLHQINPGPIQINCTSYANMMLAVYLCGNLYHPGYCPYALDIGAGSKKHLAQRYQFQIMPRKAKDGTPAVDKDGKPIRYFTSPEQIVAVVDDWEIYSMEIGSRANHGTGHHTIVHNKKVYESKDNKENPSATVTDDLDTYFKNLVPYSRWVYLFREP